MNSSGPRLLARRWREHLARAVSAARHRRGGSIRVLAHRVDVLEGQLAAVFAAQSRMSADRSDLQAVHRATALRYREFLDQDLIRVLDRAETGRDCAGCGGRGCEGRCQAEAARGICTGLFALPIVGVQTVQDVVRASGAASDTAVNAIVTDIAQTAQRLRSAVAFLAASPWSFSFMANVGLDSSYQEAWAGCDPSAPARWVVAPAYLADGEVIVKQRVYTAR